MKMIVLGGGALQVKNIKMSKGMSAAAFVEQVDDGLAIFAALRRRTGRINWANPLGNIEWVERRNRNNIITWFQNQEFAQ